jgi:ComEC/Rec2-related protein
MKRPLGLVALLYAAGLLLAEFFQPPLVLLFAVSLALAAIALLWGRARRLLIWPLVVLVGWTNLVSRTTVVSPNDLRRQLTDAAEDVVVRGTLPDTPSGRIYVHDEMETSRTLAQLSLTSIRHGTNWQAAFGQIVITTPGKLPENYFAGQEVEIAGIIAPPPRPLAEGLFDYQTYLRRQGIYFALKTSSADDWRLISSNTVPPLSDRFLAWSKATMARGLPEQDQPLRLLWSMTLGSKDVVTGEVYNPFIESGTMHIFAISGLHIALIAGILVSLLRALRLSRAWCGAVVIPLIWFYTAATGWQPSAIRSTIMMSIIIGGWSLKRPSDLLNSLAAAALVILLWDPQQLFQASFQLSFFVVLSIALCLPPLERVCDRLLRRDPLLPAELVPRWRRWLGAPLRFVLLCLATSFAAWLGSWPLTAYYFHLFSPVTLLANLLIVPISSAALACNLGSLICGAWFPWATELFNHSGWFWMWLMMKISVATTQLPGAFFYVRSPAVADFVIYYGTLIAVLSGFALAPKRRVWTAICLVGIAGFYVWRWQDADRATNLTVIPLNGGSAVYCDTAGSRNDLLVDCGNGNAVQFVMEPFLHAQGANRLPCLALTHGDLRRVGGAGLLQTLMPVGQVAIGPAPFRSPAYRRIVESLESTPERRRIVQQGDRLGEWTVLHPQLADRFAQADDNALVLRGEFHGTRVLLVSDLGRQGQNALLERTRDLHADIVVSGLPEQGEPLSDILLEAIQPKLIVIADSEFPATKRARPDLRARLERRGIPVLYTRTAGAVTIALKKNRWQASPMDGRVVTGASGASRERP